MRRILVIGAGRTATVLIDYLLSLSHLQNWDVTVADYDLSLAKQKINNHPHGKAEQLDIFDVDRRRELISAHDLVISYLPPNMHIIVAEECLNSRKHLVTASYISEEMKGLDHEARKNDLIFLNETGLDPGIDHMDLMRLKSNIEYQGGNIVSVKSCCGGLIAPESDNNPWGYKFTWSPMNVVVAGQAGATIVENGKIKEIPYQSLFSNAERINVPGAGMFDVYPNRDSARYISLFNLNGVQNFYRGTMRRPGYPSAWSRIVKLGLTDNSRRIKKSENMTYTEWMLLHLSSLNNKNHMHSLATFLNLDISSDDLHKIEWLDLFRDEKTGIENATSAEILLSLLEKKWFFDVNDKDLVVLYTSIDYIIESKLKQVTSTMLLKGEDHLNTAMAKSGGLPAGIAAKLILNKQINHSGVIIPAYEEIYKPMLAELETFGIKFNEIIE